MAECDGGMASMQFFAADRWGFDSNLSTDINVAAAMTTTSAQKESISLAVVVVT
jgi:hypothetical protein